MLCFTLEAVVVGGNDMPREDFKMSPVRLLEQYVFEGRPLFLSLVCLFVLTLEFTPISDALSYLSRIIAS